MVRLYATSSKGRVALTTKPVRITRSRKTRGGKTKNVEPTPTPSKKPPHTRAPVTRRKQASSSNNPDASYGREAGVTSGLIDELGSGDDDDDDDDEEPDFFASSHANDLREARRKISPTDHEDLFYDGSDDGDDDVYEAVNNISDSEEDVEEEKEEAFILQGFEQDLQAHGNGFFDSDYEDDPTGILDDIDGMSVLGFGPDFEDFDGPTLSDDSDTVGDVAVERRVHFSNEVDRLEILSGSQSPLLTRALLPSALSRDTGSSDTSTLANASSRSDPPAVSQRRNGYPFNDDGDDSDLTDDDLPAEAHTAPSALHRTFSEPPPEEPLSPLLQRKNGKKSKPRPRGPRTGFFQVDRDKPWAILDASGQQLVLMPVPNTDRHDWLEERRQDPSPSSSPEVALAELLDESDGSVTSSQENTDINGVADAMLASLNSAPRVDANTAHDLIIPEGVFGHQVVGDYLLTADDIFDIDGNSDVSNEADLMGDLNDFIQYDDEDDSDAEEGLTSPAIHMPPLHELSGARSVNEQFAHLNNRNVTAFRRSADPAHAALNRRLSLPEIDSRPPVSALGTVTPESRKRKTPSAAYKNDVYKGVTPVQRKVITTMKRRKLTT